MAMNIKNLTPRRPVRVRGVKIAPGETEEVDITHAQLKKHPFYVEGWIDQAKTVKVVEQDSESE